MLAPVQQPENKPAPWLRPFLADGEQKAEEKRSCTCPGDEQSHGVRLNTTVYLVFEGASWE